MPVRTDGHVAPSQQVTDDAALVGVDGEIVGEFEFCRLGYRCGVVSHQRYDAAVDSGLIEEAGAVRGTEPGLDGVGA
ncbi:hypothetical protein [Pseudonocardia ailaonensis]|uniref:hypothetical protein n=1 Tax=Pseudonocardia ailaonensis TaxID=367279 RepID=UPI0031D88208